MGCEPDWCEQLYWLTQTVCSATCFWHGMCVLVPVCLRVACQRKKAWQILWVLVFTRHRKHHGPKLASRWLLHPGAVETVQCWMYSSQLSIAQACDNLDIALHQAVLVHSDLHFLCS